VSTRRKLLLLLSFVLSLIAAGQTEGTSGQTLQLAPAAKEISSQVQERLRSIAETLPSDSLLRRMLNSGAHGDGIHHPWMDEMRYHGVKGAKVQISLTWFFGPRSLRVTRVMYFTEYDDPDSQVTDPQKTKFFQSTGLEQRLKEVALQRGLHGRWFESPLAQHPWRLGLVDAGTEVDLFDEEWLPILPEFYWNLDTAQGALTRAVASGDRFDTKNLLSERRFTTGDLDDALEWAASGMNPTMVRDLLAAGAHVNATSKSGYTPLMGAINNGRIANAKILLEAGADVSVRNPEFSDTALTLALYYKRDASEGVSLLLSKGADPNTANSRGRSALMLAVFGQPNPVLDALLRAGANVNAQDRNGNTALMEAAEDGNVSAVKLLLEAHADRTLKNASGQTALSIASFSNHEEAIRLLTQ
jgi:ankyrin repeat protein